MIEIFPAALTLSLSKRERLPFDGLRASARAY